MRKPQVGIRSLVIRSTARRSSSVRTQRRGPWHAWLLAWPGMLVAALLNGTLRAVVIQPLLGETAARQLATLVLVTILFAYQWWLSRRAPLGTARLALAVGASWTTMTLAFEIGWGRFVEHASWATLVADYDLTAGRIWVLVPLWLLLGPLIIRALHRRSPGSSGDTADPGPAPARSLAR